jgi:hypothetical protein
VAEGDSVGHGEQPVVLGSVGQLKQGQRVAAGLGNDPVPDPLIQQPGQDGGQQRSGVRRRQSLEHQPGQARYNALPGGITGGEQQGDRLGVQPAGGERQSLRRGLVQPLRVIDQA